MVQSVVDMTEFDSDLKSVLMKAAEKAVKMVIEMVGL